MKFGFAAKHRGIWPAECISEPRPVFPSSRPLSGHSRSATSCLGAFRAPAAGVHGEVLIAGARKPAHKATSGERRVGLVSVAFFEQSERAAQRIGRRLALVVGHAVGVELQP